MRRNNVKTTEKGVAEDFTRLEKVFQGRQLWGGMEREAMRDQGLFKGFRQLDMFDLQIFKVKDVDLSDGTSFKE